MAQQITPSRNLFEGAKQKNERLVYIANVRIYIVYACS
jgi:hypothetical protein